MSDGNLPNEAINALAEVSKEAYADMLAPTGKELGTTLQTVAKAINVWIAPFRLKVIAAEQFYKELEQGLTSRLQGTPTEELTQPSGSVALPALQGVTECWDEPELRNMFMNLLATSMKKKTKDRAHPAFAEIIRQLSPLEARLFNIAATSVTYKFSKDDSVYVWSEANGGAIKPLPNIVRFRERTNILTEIPAFPNWENESNPLGINPYLAARIKELPVEVDEWDYRLLATRLRPSESGFEFAEAVCIPGTVLSPGD